MTSPSNCVLHLFLIYRQSQSDKLSNRCNQLQEKLNMAISTLQQALAGVNSQVSESVQKVRLSRFDNVLASDINWGDI